MASTKQKFRVPATRILVLSIAAFILLSVASVAESRQCYWCGPLAEQVHRSLRAPPCDASTHHVTACEPGLPHCAIVATSPPHVESRYCVKLYQDECYPLFCNSTKTWKMTCPCRGDLCNGPSSEREIEAFTILNKLVAKTTNVRIKKRTATSSGNITDDDKMDTNGNIASEEQQDKSDENGESRDESNEQFNQSVHKDIDTDQNENIAYSTTVVTDDNVVENNEENKITAITEQPQVDPPANDMKINDERTTTPDTQDEIDILENSEHKIDGENNTVSEIEKVAIIATVHDIVKMDQQNATLQYTVEYTNAEEVIEKKHFEIESTIHTIDIQSGKSLKVKNEKHVNQETTIDTFQVNPSTDSKPLHTNSHIKQDEPEITPETLQHTESSVDSKSLEISNSVKQNKQQPAAEALQQNEGEPALKDETTTEITTTSTIRTTTKDTSSTALNTPKPTGPGKNNAIRLHKDIFSHIIGLVLYFRI